MEINILGFWGGYPKNGEATSGYLIKADGKSILLDCGSGVYSKYSLNGKVEDLSAVILSHLHFDHMADIGIVQYAMVGALRNGYTTKKLPIFAPEEPELIFRSIQSEQSLYTKLEDSSSYNIGKIEIEFCSVTHTIPTYAVKFKYEDKVFVYSADTDYNEDLIRFAKDADLFICEATVCEGSKHTTGKGHMDAKEAAKIAKAANVKQLVLTHLPHDGDFSLMKQEASSIFGKEVSMAYEKSLYVID